MTHCLFRTITALDPLFRLLKDLIHVKLEGEKISPAEVIILCGMKNKSYSSADLSLLKIFSGRNPHHLVKKMKNTGYLEADIGGKDERMVLLKLSEKGLKIRNKLMDFFNNQEAPFLEGLVKNLQDLEVFLNREIEKTYTEIEKEEG